MDQAIFDDDSNSFQPQDAEKFIVFCQDQQQALDSNVQENEKVNDQCKAQKGSSIIQQDVKKQEEDVLKVLVQISPTKNEKIQEIKPKRGRKKKADTNVPKKTEKKRKNNLKLELVKTQSLPQLREFKLKYANILIKQFKISQLTNPFWKQILLYRFRKQKRKHDFLKQLTYQTFNLMEDQQEMPIQTIFQNVINNRPQFEGDEEKINIKKRVYDILMTLNESQFLKKYSQTNLKGKKMKKNRTYKINEEVYRNPCIKNIHLERILEVIEARKRFKKKILQSSKRFLDSIRRAKSTIKSNKIEHSHKDKFQMGIKDEIVAFYCKIPMSQDGVITETEKFSMAISQNRKLFEISSKSMHHSSIMLKADILKVVYPSNKKKRGRKPYKNRVHQVSEDEDNVKQQKQQ